MEIAIEEMLLSKSEHINKTDPMVGVVLVDKSGKELARAHRGNFSAGDHAEFTILQKLMPSEDPMGSTLFITLEPCIKREKPKKPCTQRIVEIGVGRVVIGILDPNPEIYMRGIKYLRKYGVKVDFFDEDIAEEIRRVNKRFIEFMQTNKQILKAKTMSSEKLEGSSLEEERPVPEASSEDFSTEAIQKYLWHNSLSFTISSNELRRFFIKTKFLVKRGNREVPTLLGLILFGKNPEIFCPEHRITAEFFEGTPENGIALEKIGDRGRVNITGPLLNMIKDALLFYKKHVARVPQLESSRRVDKGAEYPRKVIRETIVNAIIHRDYTVGAHISFRMFHDRIIIKSPGHLLRPNSLERVKNFDVTPVRRNPRIAAAALQMKQMEGEGYGIPRMPSLLNDYGLRAPDFDYDGGYFIVTLYGREMSPPTYRIRPEQSAQLNDRQLEILNVIWERKRITSEDCTKMFKITRDTANRDFRKLLELELIKRKGRGRATYYILG